VKIYLAARYSRCGELRGYRELLRTPGHEVTSRWLDGGHEIAREGSTRADTEARTRFALEDWEDLMAADLVISFTEVPRSTTGRGGRHVEFGAAMASGKQCVVVGPREDVFHCLPRVQVFNCWANFLDACFPLQPGHVRGMVEAIAKGVGDGA
jgi:hypothetical protein